MSEKFRLVEAEKAWKTPVKVSCELLEVSRSGYYDWERRVPCQRELTDAWITEKIKEIYQENRGVYGAPRIHAELRMAHGIRVGKKRVARLMRQAELSLVAQDLLAWSGVPILTGELALAEPKRLRQRLFHVAGRTCRSGRRVILRLPKSWPWAEALEAAFARLRSLPAPLLA